MIENFCPHMVRHTYTGLACSAGADIKIVSQNLGHASTSVTLDAYTHLTNEKTRTIVRKEKILDMIFVEMQ